MSNFWDGIIFSTKVEKVVESKSDFWASMGVGAKPKPVKQSKPKKVKVSKAVVKAERVYETVDNMVVPAEDCKHHWLIPANAKWVIGTCKLCSGERWFKTQFEVEFNDSLSHATGVKALADSIEMLSMEGVDVLKEVFKAEQTAAAMAESK